jgi:hypothetical protein
MRPQSDLKFFPNGYAIKPAGVGSNSSARTFFILAAPDGGVARLPFYGFV